MKIKFTTSVAARNYSFNCGQELDSESTSCNFTEDQLQTFVDRDWAFVVKPKGENAPATTDGNIAVPTGASPEIREPKSATATTPAKAAPKARRQS